jgi:hypothetical protein
VRYLERWALEADCVGGTLNKQADSFVTFTQPGERHVTGLTHLIGQSVVVWQDGVCPEDADGEIRHLHRGRRGQITLDTRRAPAWSASPTRTVAKREARAAAGGMLGTPLTSKRSSRASA